MAAVLWQQDSETNYKLVGKLTRETVPNLWKTLQQWQPDSQQIDVSLAEIERVDSAGMVLLIHLLKQAKKHHCHIMFSFVPQALTMLFTLSNAEHILNQHSQINEI